MADMRLAVDGKSEYVIVLPQAPTPVEQTAARELGEYLGKVTGAVLPILPENQAPADRPHSVVGDSALARQLVPGLEPKQLGHDAIVIQTVGRDLVLVGHPRRGTLYAVLTFLEDTVGIRWWTQTETYIPQRATLRIPEQNVAYTPVVRDRATRYLETSDGCFTSHSLVTPEEQRAMGVFSARLRLNGHDHYTIPAEYGGADGLVGWVHTFYQINGLLPPATYFADHPEWYSLVGGKRIDQHGQLCLANPGMRAEMVRVVRERLRANPAATMISISQNDWRGNCECDACRAVDEREGTPAGSLIHFINTVAEEIEPEFPDVLVETLAYQYTRKPPRLVRPRRNVIIRLCSIECSFAEPLETGERNRAFREDLEGWGRITDKLYIWDYVTNFHGYLLPHANYQVLAPNLRYFVRHHAVGIFEQGDSGCRVGDFVRFRAWLLAHLLWNPAADEVALTQEFMVGYYGPAAPYLLAYQDALRAAVERADIHLGCFRPDTSDWLQLADMNRGMELFAQALAAVQDDPQLTERVRRERLPLDHVWLRRYRPLQMESRRRGLPFRGPADPQAAMQEFLALVRQHRVGEIQQGRLFPADFADSFLFDLPPAAAPEECAGLPEEDWIDLQDTDYIPRSHPGLFQIVTDPAAANQRARRMPNTHTVWACHSYPLGSYGVTDGSRWQVRFRVRCEAATDDGIAMTLGIYDDANRKSIVSRQIAVKDIRGDSYQTIDLGVHPLSEAMYVWAAPVVRKPEDVAAVYVDRVFLVRERRP